MESDAERGVGSSEYGGEELSLPLTIAKLNRGMDSIVAKAGTLPTLKNVAGITSFERKFKSGVITSVVGPSARCSPGTLRRADQLNTHRSQLSGPLRAGAPHPQPQSPPRMPERDH